MMEKLSRFSVNYPVTIMMGVLAVLLLGYISFSNLGMDLFPDLNNPRIYVSAKAGEKPPEEMEDQYIKNIEAIAIRQNKVVDVSSVSKTGAAEITVEYAWEADMDEAFLDLQKSLANFNQNSGMDELTISQHDPNSSPVVIIGLYNPQISDMDELRKVAANYLQNELIRLEGIAAVEIIGGEEKEVIVETSSYLMDAYGLDLETLSTRIRSSNVTASGGSITEMGLKYIIRGIGSFSSLDDIKKVIVTDKQSEENSDERIPVFLEDVAKITYKNKDPENIVRIDGKRCIALAIYKETRYNTVKAVAQLTESLSRLEEALPGYQLIMLQNQADFINSAIGEVEETALIGVILAVIILYVFLRRIGTTAIISIAIPVSIIATFNLMYFNGLTLNIMTLGGLALGAGMLVDNAIIVMENIFRNLESGMSLRDAAIAGSAQVGGAITASTLTTVVVFLPIVYLHGAAGELFRDQAWTVAFSLLSSLLVAILVIPMLSHRLLKLRTADLKPASYRFEWYPAVLARLLDKRWQVIIGMVLLLCISLLLLPFIGSDFMPQGDTNVLMMEVTLPEGTSLEYMDKVAVQFEESLYELIGPEIDKLYTRVGPLPQTVSDQTSAELQDANIAVLTVYLKSGSSEHAAALITRLGRLFPNTPERKIRLYREQTSLQTTLGTSQAPLVVEVRGDDLNILRSLSGEIQTRLDSLDGVFNVRSSFDEGRPEVNIVFDRLRAGAYNLDLASVGTQLKDQLQGKIADSWDNEGETRDITLRLPDVSVDEIAGLIITSGQSRIRLDEVSRIEAGIGAKEIHRRNQVRTGLIEAQIKEDMPLDQISSQIREIIRKINLPPDYQVEITGEEMMRSKSFENLKFALILSIILIYMVLASQFESLVHPFIILLTIPMAVVGVIILFFVLNMSFNVMAYIGIIMLVGIAVNDSIILVDAINQLQRSGMSRRESIVEAGHRRIRPIIMTSLTTILALLPLTIGFGESVALRSPMAVAVIGGLITSTLLTLVVIPCVYEVIDEIKWFGKKSRAETTEH